MNRPTSFGTNAANATVELDCPWCAEPIAVGLAELEDGLACTACGIEVELAEPAPWSAEPTLDRLAA